MQSARGMLLMALLACAAAFAQGENPYSGKWTATWVGTTTSEGPATQHQNQAEVVIRDNGGSFQNLKSGRRNPCVGQKTPISVKKATAEELIFVIEFSGVMAGCQDSKVTLKRVDDKTLKGLRDKDKEITMVRE